MARTKTEILIATIELVRSGVLEADYRFLEADFGELLRICNGCGTDKSYLVPDTMWGLYIGFCCYLHDFDYKMGTTEADRRFADARFKKNLQALVKAHSNFLTKVARDIRINTYYNSVRICGEKPFWQGKDAINVVTLSTYQLSPLLAE